MNPQYVFLLGFQPGVTAIPGGQLAPLAVNDPLVQASLFGSLGAYLTNASGSMTAFAPCNGICGALFFISPDITLTHPNVAGLSGVVLRSAVVSYDSATGFWGTSQPEELTLQ